MMIRTLQIGPRHFTNVVVPQEYLFPPNLGLVGPWHFRTLESSNMDNTVFRLPSGQLASLPIHEKGTHLFRSWRCPHDYFWERTSKICMGYSLYSLGRGWPWRDEHSSTRRVVYSGWDATLRCGAAEWCAWPILTGNKLLIRQSTRVLQARKGTVGRSIVIWLTWCSCSGSFDH